MLYRQMVKRFVEVEKEESIEVPAELVKLVNGNDPRYGRNGHFWLGCNRGKSRTIDRLYQYVQNHQDEITFSRVGGCQCPIKL